MKKILKGITSLAALAFLAAGLTGCPGTTGTNSGETSSDLWEDAVEIEELAGKEISWGKDANGAETSCIVPLSLAKRLQKDSKIIFELDYNSIDAEYIQLHVDDGNWGATGVKDFYNKKGAKVDSEEEVDGETKTGRYKIDVIPGTYYTVVTEDILDKLKTGFGFNGNFKLVKAGLTNLAEAEEPAPEAEVGDVVYSAEGEALTVNLAQNAYDAQDGKGNIVRGIQFAGSGSIYLPAGAKAGDVYEISLAGKADAAFSARVQFLDASWGGIVSTDTGDDIPLTDFTAKDFELTLKVKFNTSTADGFKFVIGNTEEGAEARTLTLTSFTIKKIAEGESTEGETKPAEDPEEGKTDEEGETTADDRPEVGTVVYTASGDALTISLPQNIYGEPAVSHGVQFAPAGTTYLPKGAKNGEAYTITLKGSADAAFEANIQFLTSSWGGFGEAVHANFTTDAFEVSGEYTFGSDTGDGFMFVISNTDPECTAKTLTLTEFTIKRTK